MIGHDPERGTAENYRRFAAVEARERSPVYEEFAIDVADDPELLAFLETLPLDKRQPNLLLASVRYLTGLLPGYGAFRATVLDRREEVAAVMLARRTQTNEPARCATLLPALALLPQPLALLEVGASAGLCLLPDRYSYAYGPHRIDGRPVFACQARGPVPLPARSPEVVWRAGIDLNPLDVADPDDMHWLSCLVWPGEGERAGRLAAAISIARGDPPRVVRGTWWISSPRLQHRPRPRRPWWCSTRRSSPISPPSVVLSSPKRSAPWVGSGCPMRHRGFFRTCPAPPLNYPLLIPVPPRSCSLVAAGKH
jgi:hypothetical protein